MKLAFSNEAKYTDFTPGYELYLKRNRTGNPVDEATYRRVLKAYCKMMAERLQNDGIVDLPCGLGSICAALIRKKAQYRNGKFDGYGAMDWKTGKRDGKLKAFGLVFLPKHEKGSLRSYGFVGNRKLFQRMKEMYSGYECPWTLIEFNDEMI